MSTHPHSLFSLTLSSKTWIVSSTNVCPRLFPYSLRCTYSTCIDRCIFEHEPGILLWSNCFKLWGNGVRDSGHKKAQPVPKNWIIKWGMPDSVLLPPVVSHGMLSFQLTLKGNRKDTWKGKEWTDNREYTFLRCYVKQSRTQKMITTVEGRFFCFYFHVFFSFRDVIRSIKSSKKNRTILTERKNLSQNLEKKIMSLINIVI